MKKNYKKIIKLLILFIIMLLSVLITNNRVFADNSDNKKTIEEGTYIIKSAVDENYVLDIEDKSKEKGANLELWKANNQDNQKFTLKYLGDGYYTISAVHSGQCVDVEGNGTTKGTNVLQWTSNGGDNQKWLIKDVGNGYYSVISKINGLYLDVPYSKAEKGANIQVWTGNGGQNQKFKFEKQSTSTINNIVGTSVNGNIPTGSKTIADGMYTIKSAIDENYVFDIASESFDNGANLELWTNKKANNQKFRVKYLGDGVYSIVAVHSEKSIDVQGASKNKGSNVLQWSSNSGDNQKWIIKDAGNGYYNIISKISGLYLDIPYSKVENGSNVQVWTGNSGKNQMFKFEKTTETATKTINNGMYTVKCVANSKVLDISGGDLDNRGNLIVYTNNSKANQKLNIKYLGNGYYKLELVHSGKVVDVQGESTKSGANVFQWTSNNGDNQQWMIKSLGSGNYNIISKISGLYLTVTSSGNVCVMKADNSSYQKFKFENANTVPSINTSKYPGYKEKIQSLMSKHPNWNFQLLYTGLKFENVVAGEAKVHSRNLVPSSYKGEWVCSVCGTKLYDSGWYCASEKATAYYMDPRNFLDETNVFQFLDVNQYIEDVNAVSGIKTEVKGTFLENYSSAIYNACRNKKVNAYYIISRLIQEQGRSGTKIGKGMSGGDGKTYYNPFNIGASGNGYTQIYNNALKTAKSYGWTSMQKAIEGGIDFCKKNWLDNYQNTLYQNKFDIDTRNGTSLYTHQYMQNLMGAYSEARLFKGMYEDIGKVNSYSTFIIPVYEGMSSKISELPKSTSEVYPMNVQITENSVSLRQEAKDSAKVLKTITSKSTVILSVQRGINTSWQKVILTDGTIGYIQGKYLKQIDDLTNCNYSAKVKTNDGSGCYVRIGPSTNLDKLTALVESTKVRVIDSGRYKNINGYDWCRVELSDGRQGFMPIKFLVKV